MWQLKSQKSAARILFRDAKGIFWRPIPSCRTESPKIPFIAPPTLSLSHSRSDYLREADNAMYQAKSQSLGVCVFQAMESE